MNHNELGSLAIPLVFVVDDDVSVRESLASLVQSVGWIAETFASAQEFLCRPQPPTPHCLVLDASLPGLSGLELQQRLSPIGRTCRSSSSPATAMLQRQSKP
jgi:FixJ family two-component response regulator